jgi:hypothetical protein
LGRTAIDLEFLGNLLFGLLKQPIELALLQVAHKDLLLLGLGHLAELPQLILLEYAEGFQVRDPLLTDLVVIYRLVA